MTTTTPTDMRSELIEWLHGLPDELRTMTLDAALDRVCALRETYDVPDYADLFTDALYELRAERRGES